MKIEGLEKEKIIDFLIELKVLKKVELLKNVKYPNLNEMTIKSLEKDIKQISLIVENIIKS